MRWFADNEVGGEDFKTLTDRDLKDIMLAFVMRKRTRRWVNSMVCT